MGVDQRSQTRRRMIGGLRTTPTSNSVLKTYHWNQDQFGTLQKRKIMRDLNQGIGSRNRMIRTFDGHVIHKGPTHHDWLILDDIIRIHLWSWHLSPPQTSLDWPQQAIR